MSHAPDGQQSEASAGFTLLELMIALALTGLLSLVAYTSLSLSFKAMRHGRGGRRAAAGTPGGADHPDPVLQFVRCRGP